MRVGSPAGEPNGGYTDMHNPDTAGLRRPAGISAGDEALLAALPLFSGMAREALRALLMDASVRRLPRHAMLFAQGDPAAHFFVVLSGWIKLFRIAPDGRETVIAAFARGESFAEAAGFAEGRFPVGAQVVEDARVLAVPAASFAARLRRQPELAFNMLASMSRHLRGLVREVEQRTVRSAAQRAGAFLLKLCPADSGAAEIDLPTEKALVASRLGMRAETLSRAIAALRPVGVRLRDRHAAIADVEALRRFAEGGARPPAEKTGET